MNIYNEIIKLRDSTIDSLQLIQHVPKLTPYGSIYTATLIVDDKALSEVFKFNPHTYASEDIDGIIERLVEKSGLVEGTLGHVECTEGALCHLLVPSEDKKFYNGVSASHDRKTVIIPGTGIRYTVKKPNAKRNTYSDWKNLDKSVQIVIHAVGEWTDPKVDENNKKNLDKWLVKTSSDVSIALACLKNLNELVTDTIFNK